MLEGLDVDGAGVERVPGVGGGVVHLDPHAAGDVLGHEHRLVEHLHLLAQLVLAVHSVLRLQGLLVAHTVKPMRAQRGGGGVHRVAVLLRRQQPREGEEVAVELQGGAVGIHVEHAEAGVVGDAQAAVLPVLGRGLGDERVADGLAARAGGPEGRLVAGRGDARREPLARRQAREIVHLEVDDEPEDALEHRVVADQRAPLVEVGPGPVVVGSVAVGSGRSL